MTKGEAIRIVEGWIREVDGPDKAVYKLAERNPPTAAILRLLQEVKRDGKA